MEKKCFEFSDYKEFLRHWISAQPGGGRGLYRKFALLLKIHTTMMSHILGGKQQLSDDQALVLSEYMGLSESETDYFVELVRLGRASTPKLRVRLSKRLDAIKTEGREVKNRILEHHRLSDEESAQFYSSWFYSALRLMSDIPKFQTRARLVEGLNIPRETANEALQFLIKAGLCRETSKGIEIGPSRTHLAASSPFIWNLHKNWRLKAIERHTQLDSTELLYTAPMSISSKDVEKIREVLAQTIAEITKIAANSSPEELVCLNMDWFGVK